MAETVFIGIGSNVGEKKENIQRALNFLRRKAGLAMIGVAPIYRSQPVGYMDQDWFLNTVAEFKTGLLPHDLLKTLLDIENEMGRKRIIRWGPRVIDLDILLYGGLNVKSPDLEIPHPLMNKRAFVVVPLADLRPELMLPGGVAAVRLAVELLKDQPVEKAGRLF